MDQSESNIIIDKTMADGNSEDCLTCEEEFHRLAKIDHFVDTYRVPHMITATSELLDSAKSGEDINTLKDFFMATVVSEPQDSAKSGEGIKDAEIKIIIDFDDKKARELLLSRM